VTFAAVFLGGLFLQWHNLSLPEPHVDERVYLRAFDIVDRGGNPYDDADFVYAPPFAHAGAALRRALGPERFLVAFRMASLAGLWILVWVSLHGSRWPLPVKAGVGLAVLESQLVGNGLGCGNVSVLMLGPLLAAMALAPRWPVLGGAVLGALNAFKPTAVSALVVLAAPPRGGRLSAAAVRMLVAAGVAAGLCLLIGLEHLPSMLRRAGGFPDRIINLAPARVFHAWGMPVPPVLLFAAFTILGTLYAWRRARTPRERLAVAGTTSLLALPVINPNTLLLSFPAQMLALELAAASYAGTRRSGASAGRQLAELVLVAGAVLSIHGAEGAVSTGELPPVVQGLVTAIPLLGVAALTWYAVSGTAASRAIRSAGATPAPAPVSLEAPAVREAPGR
jgi:hypothetical protein